MQANAFVFRRQRCWKLENFRTEFDIFVEAAYSNKNDRTRAYILLNLAGKDAIEKAKTFTYAAEVRNEDGDIIQAAESRERVAVLKAKFRGLQPTD